MNSASLPLPLMAFTWPSWFEKIPLPPPYNKYALASAAAVIVLLVLRKVFGMAGRFMRSRRPVTIHPSLQKYNIDNAELGRKRREQAVQIIATSTGNRLAGFRIVRQVDAVFVEGFRTPEDALIALKATAAERGANAILNVQTERTTAGKCTASGDAIVVAPLVAKMPQRRSPESPLPPPSPPVPLPPPLPPPQTRE